MARTVPFTTLKRILIVTNRLRIWQLAILCWGLGLPGAQGEPFTRQQDVVYGHKDGMALTMDVFTPEKANGAAIIWVVSGGLKSSHEFIQPVFILPFLAHGYRVFAVVHSSQPRYTATEVIPDIGRAVRYIRYRAKDFGIAPERLGITGASSGGHLSLFQGVAGDVGNPEAKDPVERVSSRVQAVACFFPPTDFLNYGEPGKVDLGTGLLAHFKAAFAFQELDARKRELVPITDPARRREIGRQISPVYHVTEDDPPTLIIHGDADTLVPLQQSERIMARFKEVGVPAELIVKQGAGHGWPTILLDVDKFADWFDKHLK